MTFIEHKEGSSTIEVMEKNPYIGFYWLEITEGKKTSVHWTVYYEYIIHYSYVKANVSQNVFHKVLLIRKCKL